MDLGGNACARGPSHPPVALAVASDPLLDGVRADGPCNVQTIDADPGANVLVSAGAGLVCEPVSDDVVATRDLASREARPVVAGDGPGTRAAVWRRGVIGIGTWILDPAVADNARLRSYLVRWLCGDTVGARGSTA